MRFDDIAPFVRFCHAFTVEKDAPLGPWICLDRRLLYARRGKGALVVAGERMDARLGDLFLLPAGTMYALLGPVEFVGVNFDLFSVPGAPSVPVAPVPPALYRDDLRTEALPVECQPALDRPVALSGAEFAEAPLSRMLEEYAGRRLHFRAALAGEAQALIVQIVRRALQGEPDDLAERALAYIRAHYREPISNAALAAEFHFHPSTIARALRRHTGAPPHRYLAEYRVRQAVGLMESRAVTVEQAARAVGFEDANYFSRYFKKLMGICPSAYLLGARDPRRAPEGVIDHAIDPAPDL